MPSAPPATERIRLSVTSIRISVHFGQPSARRVAISWDLRDVRTSWRLARLTQAMRSTIAVRAMTSQVSWEPRSPMASVGYGTTLSPRPLFVFGKSWANFTAMAAISSLACLSVTPGLRRAATWYHPPSR